MTSNPPEGQPAVPAPIQRTLPDNLIAERSGATVWWSNIKRDGEWILPRLFRVFTCMGNVELDLTHARMSVGRPRSSISLRMSADVSEIEIMCVLANVEITVPTDVRVICEGEGLMGNFETQRIGEIPPVPIEAPTVRITGNAYLGSVTVKVIGKTDPGWRGKLKAWAALNS